MFDAAERVGAAKIGVRDSIWSRVFIVGAGAPGGVRLPWAKAVDGGGRRVDRASASAASWSGVFMVYFSPGRSF